MSDSPASTEIVADLLAALKAALVQTEDGLHYSPDCDVPDCWVEMARAAIAAAESREPQP